LAEPARQLPKKVARRRLTKRLVRKDDGRYLILYERQRPRRLK
jgi:hypothetical protein